MRIIFLSLFVILCMPGQSQNTQISGKITDNRRKPLQGVSISIKNSYDGTTTDSSGQFRFSSAENGDRFLVITSLGYKPIEHPVNLAGTAIQLEFSLKEELNELKALPTEAELAKLLAKHGQKLIGPPMKL